MNKQKAHNSFREFYVLNSEALFRGSTRCLSLAYLILLLEAVEVLSLCFSQSYLVLEESESLFKYISLHALPQKSASVIALILFSLNSLCLMTLLVLLAVFLYKPFKKQTIPLFSQFVLSYNHVLLIPSIYTSITSVKNEYYTGLTAIFVVSIVQTLVISFLCTLNSGRFYRYFNSDGLAKQGSIWDFIRFPLIVAMILIFEGWDIQDNYAYFLIVIQAITIYDNLRRNAYYNESILRFSIACNLSNLAQSIIVVIQIGNAESFEISAIVPFLCTVAMAWRLAQRVIQFQKEAIQNKISGLLDGSISDGHLSIDREEKIFLIDFFTRKGIENIDFCPKNSQVMLQFFNKIIQFPNEIGRNINPNHLGSLIQTEEIMAIDSLKDQVKSLSERLENRAEGNGKHKNNPSDRSRIPSLVSLFYLLEIEQNYTKLAIKLQEFMSTNKTYRSIRDESFIWHLENEMERREACQRAQIAVSAENKFIKSIDLAQAFQFQEDLVKLTELVMSALKTKIDFLNEISKDCIHIDNLYIQGIDLVEQNLRISNSIMALQLRSRNSSELLLICNIFLECLWIDPLDTKFKLNWKSQRYQLRKDADTSQFDGIISQQPHILDFKKISVSECSVLVSLNDSRLGKVLKVSENSSDITGFSPIELINQNCSIILPQSIASNHNFMIRQGIDNGLLRYYSKGQSPLVMKRKDGLGVRISLQFQMHTMGGVRESIEIGIVANICLREVEFEKYLLVDISDSISRVEVSSEHLFQKLLYRYFPAPSSVQGVNLGLIIPAIIRLGEHLQQQGENKIKFATLAFLPMNQNDKKRRKLHDSRSDIYQMAKKRCFNKWQNDVYLFDISATFFSRNNAYQVLFVKIKHYRRISDDSELSVLLKNLFAPQLEKFQDIPEDDAQLIAESVFEQAAFERSTADDTMIATDRKSKTIVMNNLVKHQIHTEEASMLPLLNENHATAFNEYSFQTGNEPLFNHHEGSFLQQQQNITMANVQMATSHNLLSLVSLNSPLTSPRVITTELHTDQAEQQKLHRNNSQSSFQFTTADNNTTLLHSKKPIEKRNDKNSFANKRDDIFDQQMKQLSISKKLTAEPLTASTKSQRSLLTASKNNNMNSVHDIVSHLRSSHEEKKQNIADMYFSGRKKQSDLDNQTNIDSEGASQKNGGRSGGGYSNTDEQQQQKSERVSLSSQVSSAQSQSLKSALHRRLFSSNKSAMQIALMIYILLSFMGILIIVTVTYLQLRSSIQSQELSFEYLWWSDEIMNEIGSIQRYTKQQQLLTLLAYTSGLSQDYLDLLTSIPGKINSLYAEIIKQIASLSFENFYDLYLVELLYTMQNSYIQMIDTTTTRIITMNVMTFFSNASLLTYEMAQSWFGQGKLVELELMSNFSVFTNTLSQMTTKLAKSYSDMSDTMNGQVLQTLMLILGISIAIAFILLPFYHLFQTKREFVLKLFASIEPSSISKMYECSSKRITQISENRAKGQTALNNKQLRRQTTQLNQPYLVKKKKNVPTTPLTKISLKLLIQIFSIVLTINIQPIVNSFLIASQTSETQTEYVIVSNLYSLQSSLVMTEYALFAHTAILANAASSYVTATQEQQILIMYIQTLKTQTSQLAQTVQSLQSNSRYNDSEMGTFIFQIFTADMCEALKTAKASYFINNDPFDYSLCIGLYDGILEKGFLQTLSKFQQIFTYYQEISQFQDLTSPAVYQMYTDFYAANSINDLEDMTSMIDIAKVAVVNCISQEKEKYYNTINLVQFFLFLFEVLFVLILLPTVVFTFFQDNKKQMSNSIRMLSILQIQQIHENSYISNFVRKNKNY